MSELAEGRWDGLEERRGETQRGMKERKGEVRQEARRQMDRWRDKGVNERKDKMSEGWSGEGCRRGRVRRDKRHGDRWIEGETEE